MVPVQEVIVNYLVDVPKAIGVGIEEKTANQKPIINKEPTEKV